MPSKAEIGDRERLARQASFEKETGETPSKWAERLLVEILNKHTDATAESTPENQYAVDLWIEWSGRMIPVDVTLRKKSEGGFSWERVNDRGIKDHKLSHLEKKYRKAVTVGVAVFELNRYDITPEMMRDALVERDEELLEQIVTGLKKSIEFWAKKLDQKGETFVTKEEFESLLAG